LAIDKIKEEIAEAELFDVTISALYIATTTDYDSTLQRQVRALSDKRVVLGKLALFVLFWDDIASALLLNPAVASSCDPCKCRQQKALARS